MMIWRIHQPGRYLMKYFSIRSPQEIAKGIYKRNACYMDNPPSGPEKSYLLIETFLCHIPSCRTGVIVKVYGTLHADTMIYVID